jgi:hypothetical protein
LPAANQSKREICGSYQAIFWSNRFFYTAFAVKNASSEVSNEAFEVPNASSEVSNEAFEVSNASPEVSNEAFEVPNASSEVSNEAFEVSNASSEVSNEAFEVSNASSEVSNEAFEISNEAFMRRFGAEKTPRALVQFLAVAQQKDTAAQDFPPYALLEHNEALYAAFARGWWLNAHDQAREARRKNSTQRTETERNQIYAVKQAGHQKSAIALGCNWGKTAQAVGDRPIFLAYSGGAGVDRVATLSADIFMSATARTEHGSLATLSKGQE